MKQGQRLWTRDELLLALNLYCKIPFGKIHKGNPEVITLASLINRTPSSVALKLVNFASLDPVLKQRGIQGASNTSKADKAIWDEFFSNLDTFSFETENIRANLQNQSIFDVHHIEEKELLKEGKSKEALVKIRVNQSFFRSMVLSSYNFTCCITGLADVRLLIASHIKPWSVDEGNRLNPQNGLAINALHDRAFESGLLTITPEFKIKISSILKEKSSQVNAEYFLKYDGKEINMPSRFLPDVKFLKYHNSERFIT
jgi:putative restriction endonuclease